MLNPQPSGGAVSPASVAWFIGGGLLLASAVIAVIAIVLADRGTGRPVGTSSLVSTTRL